MNGFVDTLTSSLDRRTDPAVLFEGGAWSGRELVNRAGSASEWLRELKTPVDEPIPALLEASPASLALVLGGMIARRPLAPLNVRSTPAELGSLMANSGKSILIADEAHAPAAGRVPDAELTIVPELPPAATCGRPSPAGPPDSLAVVLHTAGTTGTSKPVRFTDRVLAARTRVHAGAIDLRAGDRYASPALFHHIAGLGAYLTTLAAGGSVMPMPSFSLEAWRAASELEPTHVLLVPAIIEALLAAGELRGGMRVLIYGAAPIRPETLRRLIASLPGTQIVQLFGQTEGSPLTRLSHEDHMDALRSEDGVLGSVGRALPEVELRLEQIDGQGVGEIAVRGPHLARADADGWLRTGDLASMEAEFVTLRGRRADMIIRGGENIFPLEVERVLDADPGVREAVVVGRPDERLGEVPWAFVVAVPGGDGLDEAALRARTRAALAAFKVPVGWTPIEELPRNAAGKVLRRDLLTKLSNYSEQDENAR